MRRIRVMHVLYSLGTGGIELGLRRLVIGLDPNRFEHLVCVVTKPPDCVGVPAPIIWLGRAHGQRSFLIPDLFKTIRRAKPDVVHSRNWGTIEAIPAASLLRVPLIVHAEHGRDLDGLGGEPLHRRLIRKFCYTRAHRVLTVSRELAEYYSGLVGLPQSRFEIMLDGVDTDEFRFKPELRRQVRAQYGIENGTFAIGCVARFSPVKNHKVLFEAMDKLAQRNPAVQLLLAGDGPDRTDLQEFVAVRPVLNKCVRFLGDVRNVRELLNGFDAFVLPSLSEGISVALLEAMSVGLPVVASAVGGNVEIIEDSKSGLLFPAPEPERLMEHLEMLITRPQLSIAIAAAARERVEKVFSFKSLLERYTALYTSVRPNC